MWIRKLRREFLRFWNTLIEKWFGGWGTPSNISRFPRTKLCELTNRAVSTSEKLTANFGLKGILKRQQAREAEKAKEAKEDLLINEDDCFFPKHTRPESKIEAFNRKSQEFYTKVRPIIDSFNKRLLNNQQRLFKELRRVNWSKVAYDIKWWFWFFLDTRVQCSIYIYCLMLDVTFADDEPLWEPTEWSFLQTWILFTFSFSWIMENLISSRYGSYIGRDKKVWLGWYKTYWMVQVFYALSYAAAGIFFTTIFYNEFVYPVFYIYSWWHWFNRTFLFKYTFVSVTMLTIGQYLALTCRAISWQKGLILIGTIIFILSYMLFTQFVLVFFGYLTDADWFHKYRANVYSALTHSPWKWGYGKSKSRENFYEHCSRTVFWFKNDDPFAGSLIMFHIFFFVGLFTIFVYWITLFKRVYYMREIPLTFTIYCVECIRHFTHFFLLIYACVFFSLIVNYMRIPYEFSPHSSHKSFLRIFIQVMIDYPEFLKMIYWDKTLPPKIRETH